MCPDIEAVSRSNMVGGTWKGLAADGFDAPSCPGGRKTETNSCPCHPAHPPPPQPPSPPSALPPPAPAALSVLLLLLFQLTKIEKYCILVGGRLS